MAWDAKGKVTRRERLLTEMDAVIPWSRLLALIQLCYPRAGLGCQSLGLEKMLHSYFLQHWFNLSDLQAEDAIYDSESMRRFERVELGDDVVPDENTILRCRHLLERQRLTRAIFEVVAAALPYSTSCHTFRATLLWSISKTAARRSMPSKSSRTTRPGLLSSLIVLRMRFLLTKLRRSNFKGWNCQG
jgi:hypothetical protein